MWKRILILLLFCFSLSAFSAEFDSDIRRLLQTQIYPVLSQELWCSRDAYDTGMFLLIPCAYAFEKGDIGLQNAFSDHFRRFTDFMNSPKGSNWEQVLVLHREHYLMLLSFFIKNSAEYNSLSLVTPEMVKVVESFIISEWHEHRRPWSRKLFPMKDHLERILSGGKVYPEQRREFSYYRLFTDLDLFPLAVMGNMHYYYKKTGISNESSAICQEGMMLVMRFLRQEIQWDEAKRFWALQPGLWKEHPDFAYSGYETAIPDMPPKPADGVEWDTSHAQRHPVFLYFWQEAADDRDDQEYIAILRASLFDKFYEKILVPPTPQVPFWRMVNNMNGSNGFYRYDPKTGHGYGPFAHTHALLYGWYAYKAPEKIKRVFRDIAGYFPLDERAQQIYCDPKTTREQNPYFKHSMKYGHAWDTFELLVKMAASE